MYSIVIALIFINFVGDINGALLKSPASIDEDAVELAQLIQKLWSFRPALLQRTKPVVYCEFIDECCATEDRLEAISLIGQYSSSYARYHFNQIMATCMNSTRLQRENPFCSSFSGSIISQRMAYQNADVKKYIDVIDNHEKDFLKMFFRITSTCNGEQMHALLCSTNKKLIQTCAGKLLQDIYDRNDYKNYQEIARKTNKGLVHIIQELSEIFTKNTK
jgi:hypothetical protein